MEPGGRAPRWRRLLRRVCDTAPPTGRGLLLAAVSGGALWLYGLRALDLVLFVAGIAGLVLVALCLLVVGACGLLLRRRVRRIPPTEPRALEAGHPARTGFEAPALSLLPLVKVRWEWVEPPGVEVRPLAMGRRLVEAVRASRRCQLGAIVRRFVVHDVFGLCRVAFEAVEAAPLTILPDIGRLKSMPVVESMASGENLAHPVGAPEGDRMEIRHYAPGDPMRHILWRVFARTRQLNVRLPERAVAQTTKTVAYLVSGPRDEPAAAAARVALETGALGPGWVFDADGSGEPTEDPERALLAIARSGYRGADGSPACGLAAFLEKTLASGRAHCVVFAPASPGPWLKDALEAARRHPGTLSFVLGTDGIARPTDRPLWKRLLVSEDPPEGTAAEELSQVLRQLASVGSAAIVVDRVSGRALGRAHQQALGAIPA